MKLTAGGAAPAKDLRGRKLFRFKKIERRKPIEVQTCKRKTTN